MCTRQVREHKVYHLDLLKNVLFAYVQTIVVRDNNLKAQQILHFLKVLRNTRSLRSYWCASISAP